MKLIKTQEELLAYLDKIGYDKTDYRVAVEALIFNSEGKLLLEERGKKVQDEEGKLEGVGGSLRINDLLQALQEEFNQELAAKVVGLEIQVDRLLEVRQIQFEEKKAGSTSGIWREWVVVSHLCRIAKGTPAIGEPGKVAKLHYVTLDELFVLPEERLSRSVIVGREVYKAKYGSRPYYDLPDPDVP